MFQGFKALYLKLSGLDTIEEEYESRQIRVEEALESLNATVTRVNIKKKIREESPTEPQYASGG